jgi:glycerol-3-phosphate dehydrogenase
MGGRRAVPRARQLSRSQLLAAAPGLRPDALIGGVRFYDAQEDDARMVAVLARTAAGLGAALATNVRMDRLLHGSGPAAAELGGGRQSRVAGVAARDTLNGTCLTIRARHVVLATGAWTGGEQLSVRPSKGVHLMVPRSRIAMESGLLMRTEKSVLFVIPWGEHWLIGDTDTEWGHDPAYPAASRADIRYLLARVSSMLREPACRSSAAASTRPTGSWPAT